MFDNLLFVLRKDKVNWEFISFHMGSSETAWYNFQILDFSQASLMLWDSKEFLEKQGIALAENFVILSLPIRNFSVNTHRALLVNSNICIGFITDKTLKTEMTHKFSSLK